MNSMLDLFCGLDGASQAFEDDPRWRVVGIDNNNALNPTLTLDLASIGAVKTVIELGKFELVWASPPCVEFYKCRAPYYPEQYGKQPDMRLVNTALEIISILEPDVWVLENTRNGAHYIQEILGPPRQIHGPFYLWGNFPLFEAEVADNHKAANDTWSTNPLRANIKAKIPESISAGLHDAIMNQSILEVEYE